jgi:hypothetical protein
MGAITFFTFRRNKVPTKKQKLAVGHSYSEVIKKAVDDGDEIFKNPRKRGHPRKNRPNKWVFQQDGATCHWSEAELKLLGALGFSIEDGTILVEKECGRWPARSPDLNWMDQFVWGIMVSELRFHKINNVKELKAAILEVWDKCITPEVCAAMNARWWNKDPKVGTLAQCIFQKGTRVNTSRLEEAEKQLAKVTEDAEATGMFEAAVAHSNGL